VPTLPKIDAVGLKIFFLLIPGIIAFGIVKSIGPRRPRSDFESGLQIFVYGVSCYLITGFIEGLYLWQNSTTVEGSFWGTIGKSSLVLAALNPQSGLGADQIAYATGIGVILGIFVAVLQAYSLPHRILRLLGLSKRTNEVDIWELTHNSPDIDKWVIVRHHDNGKVYQGWVQGYSDGGDEREMLLTEVTVYAKSMDTHELVEVDKIPVLYLGLDRKNTVLELAPIKKRNFND